MKLNRFLKNKVFPSFAGLVGLKTNITLIPYTDIEGSYDEWVVRGHDPAFLIKGRYYVGWNKIQWESICSENIPLKMYWDRGSGFSEPESLIFSYLTPQNINYEALVYIPEDTLNIRIDPGERELSFVFKNFSVKKVSRLHLAIGSFKKIVSRNGMNYSSIKSMASKAYSIYRLEGSRGLWDKIKSHIVQGSDNVDKSYCRWMNKNTLTFSDIENIQKDIEENMIFKPLISIILPVYNVEEEWLRKCINSVMEQLYGNWELCIADDASTKPHIKKVLEEYEKLDSRIKVVYRTSNGHISESSNTALQIATGEYIGLLDHDDELAVNALYENVRILNQYPLADMIYSDEDKITIEGERFAPFFKPDWSPDLLLSQMYTCHFGVYKKSLINKIGGFRKGYEGSQDYDLVLRLTEITNEIYHIPKILYHWRSIPESTASGDSSKNYTHSAGLRALEDTILRRGLNAWVEGVENISNLYRVHHNAINNPKVSIIIPNKNLPCVIDTCLQSIFSKTKYSNFEVIVIDNGSQDSETFKVYDKWKNRQHTKFKWLPYNIPFNYSKINNYGVQHADGELVLLLNNDIEVITETWLEELAGQAVRPTVGVVGACLYYPDNTVQHGGVVLGIGGVAGHSHKHFSSTENGYFNRLKTVCNYTAVTAACLMVKRDLYLEVSGLNEELKVAFNDVDFCLKIWSLGYYNVWLPQVKLYHFESKSRGYEDTPEKQERFRSEIDLMKENWGDILNCDPNYNPNLTKTSEDYNINAED